MTITMQSYASASSTFNYAAQSLSASNTALYYYVLCCIIFTVCLYKIICCHRILSQVVLTMYTRPLLIPLLHNWTSDLYLMQNKLDFILISSQNASIINNASVQMWTTNFINTKTQNSTVLKKHSCHLVTLCCQLVEFSDCLDHFPPDFSFRCHIS